jgi:hypothetical protein
VAKVPEIPGTPAEIIAANPQRYFILRTDSTVYHMSGIALSQDKKELTCMLEGVPIEHLLHLQNGINGKMRYKRTKTDLPVLNEVHLYIAPDSTAIYGSMYTLELDKIQKIEVLEKDHGRTTRSWILGSLGVTVAVTGAAVLVFAAALGPHPFQFTLPQNFLHP